MSPEEEQRVEPMRLDPSKMSDDEYRDWAMRVLMGGWIPLRDYFRMYPSETQSAIDTRVNRKVWQRGVHYVVPPNANAWVNLIAIREWVQRGALDQ